MGATHVTVAVVNPADANRRWERLFLVDTGAIDCYVPANRLREIGLEPRGRRAYELEDGTEIALDVAVAQIEFMGEVVGATCHIDDIIASKEATGRQKDRESLPRLRAFRDSLLRRQPSPRFPLP